jgi:hypothetical protein
MKNKSQQDNFRQPKIVYLFVLILGTLLIGLLKPVHAASIAQGYTSTDSGLIVGMAASLSPTSTSTQQYVERATTDNLSKFIGIVTTKAANSLTITDTSETLYVATFGATRVFVSDINGVVKRGDLVTISPLKGIAMRSTDGTSNIIGTALEDYNTTGSQNVSVTKNDGSKQSATINLISINLDPHNLGISNNPKESFLSILGQAITGKSVNNWQVISGIVIFFVLLIVEGSILYGAVNSSITAIGRNPLAKKAVYRQLAQVSLIALGVLAFGLSTIYALLWA